MKAKPSTPVKPTAAKPSFSSQRVPLLCASLSIVLGCYYSLGRTSETDLLHLNNATGSDATAVLSRVGVETGVKQAQPISTPSASSPSEAEPLCVDLSSDCVAWKGMGECEQNPEYMCARACGTCTALRASAAAVAEHADGQRQRAQIQNPRCRDKSTDCPFWASTGECERNSGYMKLQCAISCNSCEWAVYENRCRKDPNATLAIPPGAIGTLFAAIDAGQFKELKPRILSRPPEPWLVVFDEFFSEEMADQIVEIADRDNGSSFTPSQGTGGVDEDGQLTATLSEYRTSSTHWCESNCLNESAVVALRERVARVTNVPDANHEYPQLLRYHTTQYYKEHSDYIPAHRDMPCGPRVYTFFVYLSDVEEGGHTSFPQLGLSVKPKKGRAVLWPSVHDDTPMEIDERTVHIANPVIRGTKFSVNFWIHQHDFKDNHRIGCTG